MTKIVDDRTRGCLVGDLQIGEWFLHHGSLFCKLGDHEFFRGVDSRLLKLSMSDKVCHVRVEIRVVSETE